MAGGSHYALEHILGKQLTKGMPYNVRDLTDKQTCSNLCYFIKKTTIIFKCLDYLCTVSQFFFKKKHLLIGTFQVILLVVAELFSLGKVFF